MSTDAMTDVVELTTPHGHKILIRNYTTHADDRIAESILNEGLSATSDDSMTAKLIFSAKALSATTAKYVELLVISVDGESSDILDLLDKLRSDDYDVIEKEVNRIISPKASSKSKQTLPLPTNDSESTAKPLSPAGKT